MNLPQVTIGMITRKQLNARIKKKTSGFETTDKQI
jgi:hypothetical protein